jgi:hypothetical protein
VTKKQNKKLSSNLLVNFPNKPLIL